MSAEYSINTITDFLAVPEERLGECLADFAAWLRLARQGQAICAGIESMFDIKGVSFDCGIFRWIDDGVRGISAFDLSDRSSARTVRVELPKDDKEG